MFCPPCLDACSEPPERADGYAGGALVGGLGGARSPPCHLNHGMTSDVNSASDRADSSWVRLPYANRVTK